MKFKIFHSIYFIHEVKRKKKDRNKRAAQQKTNQATLDSGLYCNLKLEYSNNDIKKKKSPKMQPAFLSRWKKLPNYATTL